MLLQGSAPGFWQQLTVPSGCTSPDLRTLIVSAGLENVWEQVPRAGNGSPWVTPWLLLVYNRPTVFFSDSTDVLGFKFCINSWISVKSDPDPLCSLPQPYRVSKLFWSVSREKQLRPHALILDQVLQLLETHLKLPKCLRSVCYLVWILTVMVTNAIGLFGQQELRVAHVKFSPEENLSNWNQLWLTFLVLLLTCHGFPVRFVFRTTWIVKCLVASRVVPVLFCELVPYKITWLSTQLLRMPWNTKIV